MWPSDDPVKEQYENKVKWRIRKKAEKSKVKMICYFCRNHANRLSDRAAIF